MVREGSRAICVVNNSKHDLEVVDSSGTSISVNRGKKIPAESSSPIEIGSIEVPIMFRSSGNSGTWYVKDPKNKAVFELKVQVSNLASKADKMSIGLLRNPCSPPYLFERLYSVSDGYIFIIKSTWADKPPLVDNPPLYVFNYGHFGIHAPHTNMEIASHTFVIVRSFEGDETINFECWGGASEEPSKKAPNLCYPAATFLGDEYNLALARTICCFDPNDENTKYTRSEDEKTKKLIPSGELILGNCCGIIYGRTGVCHQMANRICAAVTDIDVGERIKPPAYIASNSYWHTYGGNLHDAPQLIKEQFKDIITDDELDELKIDRETSPFLFCTWDDYFNECKKKVNDVFKTWAQTQVPDVRVSGHPGLTVFKDKLYCFHQFSGDSKKLWYATFDEKNWIDKQIKGVGLSGSPAAIVFKDKLYCFYEDSNNSGKLYYTITSDGKTWITSSGRTDEQIKGVKASGHPGLAVFKDKLYCFHQGFHQVSGDSKKLWYATFDEKNWIDTQIKGVGLSGSPEAIVFKDKLYCFYEDSNNSGKLYYTTTSDGKIWTTPSGRTDEQIEGVKVSGHPGLAVFKDKLYCFYQGSEDNGKLYYITTSDGKTWTTPSGKIDEQISGIGLSGSPAAIAFNDRLYCFYEGEKNSGNLWNIVHFSRDLTTDSKLKEVLVVC